MVSVGRAVKSCLLVLVELVDQERIVVEQLGHSLNLVALHCVKQGKRVFSTAERFVWVQHPDVLPVQSEAFVSDVQQVFEQRTSDSFPLVLGHLFGVCHHFLDFLFVLHLGSQIHHSPLKAIFELFKRVCLPNLLPLEELSLESCVRLGE